MKLQYDETVSQPYNNCKFSAGFVHGHPVDTLYLKLERTNDEPVCILLRPDEMAAIAYCASGILWSDLVKTPIETQKANPYFIKCATHTVKIR